MKVLHMNFYYKLPEDFSGTFEDAIRHYLAYRAEKGCNPNSPTNLDPDIDINIEANSIWPIFVDIVRTSDYKAVGVHSLAKLNDDNTWTSLFDSDGQP